MTLPQSKFNLSDDELKSIALMDLNWAMAETILGQLLAVALSVPHNAAKHLIHPLDGKKKADLLWKIRAEIPALTANEAVLGEVRYAFQKYRTERNIYSHGIVLTGDDGSRVASSLKGEESDVSNLPLALEKSRFAALMVGRLASALYGGSTFPELPQRPA